MFWTKEKLKTAVNVLKRSGSVLEAVDELSIRDGFDVSSDSIRRSFNRHGLMNPSHYLNSDLREIAETKFKYVPLSDKNWTMAETVELLNGYKKQFNEFVNPKPVEKVTKIIVCPDAHHPFCDKKAWSCFINAVKTVQPDVIVIIGDFIDLISVSAHQKKPKDENKLSPEINAGIKALTELREVYSGRIIYIFGNHESRFDRYVAAKAPELDDLLTLKDLLKLDKFNIEHVPYGDFIRIGKLAFSHDVGYCGISTARQSLIAFGDNLAIGHSHRASVVYSGTVEGNTHVCMNVGWLGDYNAIDYRNRNTAKREWTLGCGLIYQTSDGVSYCNFVPFIDGKCVIDGKFVSSND